MDCTYDGLLMELCTTVVFKKVQMDWKCYMIILYDYHTVWYLTIMNLFIPTLADSFSKHIVKHRDKTCFDQMCFALLHLLSQSFSFCFRLLLCSYLFVQLFPSLPLCQLSVFPAFIHDEVSLSLQSFVNPKLTLIHMNTHTFKAHRASWHYEQLMME